MTQEIITQCIKRGLRTPASLFDWLFARTRLDDETGCLVWTGAMANKGTNPSCSVQGKRGVSVRVWVWDNTRPHEPRNGRVLVATCRNKRCVHPLHAKPLTKGQSIAWHGEVGAYWTATVRRARQVSGRKGSRLNMDLARRIRADRAAGATIAELARRYPAGRTAITRVCMHETFVEVLPGASVFTLAGMQ